METIEIQAFLARINKQADFSLASSPSRTPLEFGFL